MTFGYWTHAPDILLDANLSDGIYHSHVFDSLITLIKNKKEDSSTIEFWIYGHHQIYFDEVFILKGFIAFMAIEF